MSKNLFSDSFELNAPPRNIFPYLNTSAGLTAWMADEVYMHDKNCLDFVWEKDRYPARLTGHKNNTYVRYEFDGRDGDPASYIEFRLEPSDMSSSTYLTIHDFSDINSREEYNAFWFSLVDRLKSLLES